MPPAANILLGMTEHAAGGERDGERRFWRVTEAAAVAAYLALGVGYALMIPPGAGPDEPEHLAHVESLAVHHQLPALPGSALSTDPGRIVTYQAQHPPTYYLLLTPIYWLTGHAPSLFYRTARLFSVLLGLGAILLVRRAAQVVFPQRPSVVALTVVFAATFGTFQYVCGTVNNESLAALVVAAGLYFAAVAVTEERPTLAMALLGVALGVGLVVKLTTSVLVVVVLVVAVSRAVRKEAVAARVAEGARLFGASVVWAAVVSGWWFARNSVVYGTAMVRAHYRPAAEAWTDVLLYPAPCAFVVLGDIEEVLRSLWAPRWLLRGDDEMAYFHLMMARQMNLPPGPAHVGADEVAVLAVLIMAAVGLVLVWRGSRARPRLDAPQRCLVLAALGMVVWLVLGLAYQTLFVDWTLTLFAGRYVPVILPALGLLLGTGVERLLPSRFVRPAAVVILCLLLTYNLIVMRAVLAFQAS